MAEIVRRSLEDIEEIVELNYSIFKGMYDDEPYSLEKYRKKLAGKEPVIYVAKDRDKIVGDAIAYRTVDKWFYLWVLAVHEDYRRQGVGSRLLDMIESSGREEGLHLVMAKVYNVSKGMQRLLARKGYEPKGIKVNAKNVSMSSLNFRKQLSE